MVIKTLCLDLDGTLYIDNAPIPGALEALKSLSSQYEIAFVTNTTSLSVAAIAAQMTELGFDPGTDRIFNPSRVARDVLLSSGMASGLLLAEPSAREDYHWFREVPPSSPHCRTVLIGTEGYDLTFRDLEKPLEALLAGAQLCTLQKNRFYMKNGVIALDMGPITAALEYASGKTATLFGKPSARLFETVAAKKHCTPEQMVMVGDDIEFDVFGPEDIGITSVLVRTGKYRAEYEASLTRKAHHSISSIVELQSMLNHLRG
ncbi:MAG: hypothetical protein CVV64_16940 [Candidatus Wallbacteria bacterium HGW-Wallbacteria-1]|jgi:HAD superfamily hydrolase (TIGR01458 family)|uniref:TIGR01458 family HAD-type hydrolase n=1 Tax=Candidatus Wallbacteria bacterium HGW-Wallbacteria-1 TaxID=2013854 RepID=A0A2N1PKL8_9BACT|nr:MAG: hypothetical protein CVV64_16940 [Candidatus Wallbacteria bacterium HGW-Wallbacteria-1]